MASKEEDKAQREQEMEERQAALRREIMKIQMDGTLSEDEKARRRQALMMGGSSASAAAGPSSASKQEQEGSAKKRQKKGGKEESEEDKPTFLDDTLKCAICFELCERPVTAPCQHNFCLACFNKWRAQSKFKCPSCRTEFSKQFAQEPRINTALILAIRLAKNPPKDKPAHVERRPEENRPDKAYVTDRAVRKGRANASSGRMMVTCSPDHFGPIGPEFDPERGQGVLVGEWWQDRMDCRQWGAHRPHVAGIAGQSNVGAQSVVLSGGYEDDRDEGEWFLYTGSGGKDLSGNKRTAKEHSFDQTFDKMNKALQMSCTQGLPVRVVRSAKEKRSAYAPTEDTPVRYDGVYRILRCWQKKGHNQEHLICRYLFVRADNSPAPWSSSEVGDQSEQTLPKEAQEELKQAKGVVYEIGSDPYWAFLPEQGCWGWRKPPPASRKVPGSNRPSDPCKHLKKKLAEHEKVLDKFKCGLCKKVMQEPLTAPCGDRFCKGCLDAKFAGVSDVQPTISSRSLRVRHVSKPCPRCKADLSSFLGVAQVNRGMAETIDKMVSNCEEAKREWEKAKEQVAQGKGSNEGEEDEEEEEEEEEGEEQEGDGEEQDADAPGPSSRPPKAQKKQAGDNPGADTNGKSIQPSSSRSGSRAKAATSSPANKKRGGAGARGGKKGAAEQGGEQACEGGDGDGGVHTKKVEEGSNEGGTDGGEAGPSSAAAAATTTASATAPATAQAGAGGGAAEGGGGGAPVGEREGDAQKDAGATEAEGAAEQNGVDGSADAAAQNGSADAAAQNGTAEAHTSGDANAAGTSHAPAAAPQPAPAYKYAKQLTTLNEQFPDLDGELVKCIIDDEEGDVPNARSKLRELHKSMQKEKRAATPRKPNNRKGGGKAAAANGNATAADDAAANGAATGADGAAAADANGTAAHANGAAAGANGAAAHANGAAADANGGAADANGGVGNGGGANGSAGEGAGGADADGAGAEAAGSPSKGKRGRGGKAQQGGKSSPRAKRARNT